MAASTPGVVTEADPIAEARRLVAAGAEQSVVLRVLGGAAILWQTAHVTQPGLARPLYDVDLVTRPKQRFLAAEVISANGYAPDEMFNAFQGRRRMLFRDLARDRQIDVFVGDFSMCHVIQLEARLEVDPVTIPLAELALTKLQIIELNQKDLTDLYRLFLSHDVGNAEGVTINIERMADLCSSDWGLQRTVELNIDRLLSELDGFELSDADRTVIRDRLDRLQSELTAHPKSRKWLLRAKVGDRVRWYEEPDEA